MFIYTTSLAKPCGATHPPVALAPASVIACKAIRLMPAALVPGVISSGKEVASMDNKTETSGSLPGNQGQPGADDATGSPKLPADQDAGDDTPAPDPATHEAETGETTPGPHQEQGGMRS